MSEGQWNLRCNPDVVGSAADAWTALRAVCEDAEADLTACTSRALSEWTGLDAESFAARRAQLVTSLGEAGDLASNAATALTSAAGAMRSAQGALDSAWATVMGLEWSYGPYDSIMFQVEDDADRSAVSAASTIASDVRATLEETLASCGRDLRTAASGWLEVAIDWAMVADGSSRFSSVPHEGDQVGIVVDGDSVVVSTGAGQDDITVTVDENGDIIVTVRPYTVEGDPAETVYGEATSYRIPAGSDLTIRGGGGNDVITLPSEGNLSFTVIGGEGSDRIVPQWREDGLAEGGDDRYFGMGGDDEISAGGGADYVSGGQGNDYLDGQDGDDVVVGGRGRDTLYGLGGADRLDGGTGVDYLEGGAGEDRLVGGHGDDILSGGGDNDTIHGGEGDDVSYGGTGDDLTLGGAGRDTSHDDARAAGSSNEANVNVELPIDTSRIEIIGSDDFVARVQADLDMLANSPSGRQLLENLQQNYDNSGWNGMGQGSLVIREWDPPHEGAQNSTAADGGFFDRHVDTVHYLPSIDDFMGAPPVVVLQHELAHVYDYTNGTFRSEAYEGDDPNNRPWVDAEGERHVTKVGERQAVGIAIDHDNDPSTPEIIDPEHPEEFTENGLRREFGLPLRESY